MQMEDIESILWIHFSAKNEKETIVPFAQERKKGTRRIPIQIWTEELIGIINETCSLF